MHEFLAFQTNNRKLNLDGSVGVRWLSGVRYWQGIASRLPPMRAAARWSTVFVSCLFSGQDTNVGEGVAGGGCHTMWPLLEHFHRLVSGRFLAMSNIQVATKSAQIQ